MTNLKELIGTNLQIDIYQDEDSDEIMLWIGLENGSGAEYPINNISDIANRIQTYINNYL